MLRGVRVLAVDGDPDTVALYRAFLSSKGADISVALLGQTALARVRSTWVPHVVVTDLRLPDMSGVDFARAVTKRAGRAVALIYATDNARVQSAAGEPAAGFVRRLVKPIKLDELSEALVAGVGGTR
jgi:CheY-like chemotaxis protein